MISYTSFVEEKVVKITPKQSSRAIQAFDQCKFVQIFTSCLPLITISGTNFVPSLPLITRAPSLVQNSCVNFVGNFAGPEFATDYPGTISGTKLT